MESFKLTFVFLLSTVDSVVVHYQNAEHAFRYVSFWLVGSVHYMWVICKADSKYCRESLRLQVQAHARFAEDAKVILLEFQGPQQKEESPILIDNTACQSTPTGPNVAAITAFETTSVLSAPHEQNQANTRGDLTLGAFDQDRGEA